ncbi:TetR family transcriptional regulator, partial [candidate division KSB1 bacterium]|nr:TetR family transcriptional regulator [candidate division KSB1 bacterium]
MRMESMTKTEEKIILAATDIFLEKGKDGARMQEIADRAGLNKAMLHYYFRSKDNLYYEVFGAQIQKFFDDLSDAIGETDNFSDFLWVFISNYIDFVAPKNKLVRFILWEIEKGGNMVANILKQNLHDGNQQNNFLVQKVEKAIQEKQIRSVDPVNFVISLIGMCVFPFIGRPILENVYESTRILTPEFLEQRKYEVYHLIWDG